MSLADRFARLSRRRRRFTPTAVAALETRQLLTVAAMAPAAIASAFDRHAQSLRLVQIDGGTTQHHVATAAVKHATAAHPTHATATHPVTAAVTSSRRTHPSSTALKYQLPTDFIKYHTGGSTAAGDGLQPLASYTPLVGVYTPAQVRTAYGVSALSLANQGQGTTIAIVDEYDDPNIISDANVFSAQYNLPQFNSGTGPTMAVIQDNSIAPVTSGVGTGVGGETSLDVEWAHAMAPQANIVLVEVPFSGTFYYQIFNELLHGVQLAASLPGVVAVSLSYGIGEANVGAANVISQNNTYLASGPATNVAVTVSTGDGSSPQYPASSPNVIAVGGSSLYLSSVRGKYGLENAWGGLAGAGAGGGGLSTNFAAPTYQSGNGVAFAKRAIPDVALIADPVTGVSYYDTLDVTASAPDPWGAVGGTSLAAPVFAGMIDLAQQNRLTAGKAILNSTQINNQIYQTYNSTSYSTYFRDITTGRNSNVSGSSGRTTVAGFAAGTGYDEATGVGSPIANTFVPLLSSL